MAETTNNERPAGLNKSGTIAPFVDGFMVRLLKGLLRRFAISNDILIRIGLLFATLCLIKGVMLVGFRKYLFEIYWRVGRQQFDWINYAAFLLFALLVGLNLWNLARRYENTGVRMFRSVNALVLALGILFILLTFHEGDKSHLQSVMYGILGWADLWPYYNLNFFFRAPFLAVWLAVYVVTYYLLARTGRERFILRVTAICATAYALLCLRDLVSYRMELIVADVLGVACLLFLRRDGKPLNLLWVFLPLACMGAVYFAFWRYTGQLSLPQPECGMLVGGSLVVFTGTSLLAWRRGFHAGWSWLLTFACISFLLLVNTNYPLSANYRNLMCVALTLPRYFLGELGLVLVLLTAAMCYRRWRPAGSLLWLDVINIGLIAVALVDLRLAQIMGARLDWDLLSLALGEGPKMMWRMAQPYLPVAAALLVGIVVIYTCALLGVGRLSRRSGGSSAIGRLDLGYAVVLCVLLGLAGRWALRGDKVVGQTVGVLAGSSPMWRSSSSLVMDGKDFREKASRLGMEQLVAAAPPASGQTTRGLNVVFILLESVFNKHLSLFSGKEDTQPLLSQYKDRMELFPNFYSSFAGSINARFACFTGLYPVRDYTQFTMRAVGVKSLFEVLHEHGYATSLFYSSHFDYTGFRDFLRGRDVDGMFDADTMPGEQKKRRVSWGVQEDETLGAMQQQIGKYAAANQKFFMTYIPAAPHYPYDGTPERFRKFRPQKYKDFTPHYLNELLYMDWILTSLVDGLRDAGLLDKTLIVITGDHGEMLGADGGPLGHGWALTPELANVPLIIMDPDKRNCPVNETVGSQVDLLPTILDKLGIPVATNQLYQGVSLYSANAQADRIIYLNTFGQYGVIHGRRLVLGDRNEKRGGGNNRDTIFTMQNEGARTSFVEDETPLASPYSISDFDAFQENFLRNYSQYCRIVQPTNTAQLSISK